jgi:crotonobetainyl-CoA:carnitine CoA-transferase CaiB-like acyl-CoA transferase
MKMALDGIKVIDLSQVAAVPVAARHLADFGADVIHIENPATGDSWRSYQAGQGPGNNGVPCNFNYNWENFNRNKRSATVNVAGKEGQDIIYTMVKQADVFTTNMRPFELEKFRLTYGDLKPLNRRLVYASATGFGKKGPERDAPAYDITAYWTRSGFPYMLTIAGLSGPSFRPAMGDNVVGMSLAFGIMTALYVREKTGEGQEVDVSLMHTGIYQLGFDVAGALITGLDYKDWRHDPPLEMVAKVQEAALPIMAFHSQYLMNPLASGYVSKDGQHILFMMLQPDRYWPRFCRAIGIPQYIDDPRFNTFDARYNNRAALVEIIGKAIVSKTLDEWKPFLKDIPYGARKTLQEAINDPQAEANNFFVSYEHPQRGMIRMVASPVNLSDTPATYRMPAPEFGQHTEEVLLEYGYRWEDIARFKELNVIA